jgi:hypothetical protein
VQVAGIQRATLIFSGLTVLLVLIALLLLLRVEARGIPTTDTVRG